MSNAGTVAQLKMAGMPQASYADIGPTDVSPGKEVLFLGRFNGGPKYGSRGVVREVRGRKAVEEIVRVRAGRPSDIRHNPYNILADPSRAA